MISIEQLKIWVKKYAFGKYISKDELFAHLEYVAKRSLEDKLTLEKRAELTEKKKERLHNQLKKMTIEKVIYKCKCGHKEGFDENFEVIRNISNSTVYLIPLEKYPPRICEKCGQEMGL